MHHQKPEKAKHSYYTNKENFPDYNFLTDAFVMKNYSIKMHAQEFYEINIITNGTGIHYIGDGIITASKGDVFIIPPDVEHGYDGEEGFDVFHILLSDRFMEKYLTELQTLPSFYLLFKIEPLMRKQNLEQLYLKLSKKDFAATETLLQHMNNKNFSISSSDNIVRNSLSLILISRLCEIYSRNYKTNKNAIPFHDECFMHSLRLLHEKYFEKINIETLASISHLSRSTYLRKFNALFKTTPAKYLMKIRIEAAEQLLLNTGMSISEISDKIGFFDSAHFIKAFTSEKGISPSVYRKNNIT